MNRLVYKPMTDVKRNGSKRFFLWKQVLPEIEKIFKIDCAGTVIRDSVWCNIGLVMEKTDWVILANGPENQPGRVIMYVIVTNSHLGIKRKILDIHLTRAVQDDWCEPLVRARRVDNYLRIELIHSSFAFMVSTNRGKFFEQVLNGWEVVGGVELSVTSVSVHVVCLSALK